MKALYYGPPGSGKTTMACSACELGYHVLLYDIDSKALHMKNLEKYINNHTLEIHDPKLSLTEDNLAKRMSKFTTTLSEKGHKTFALSPPEVLPKGFTAILEFLTECEQGKHPADIFVFDNFTRSADHMRRHLNYFTKHTHFDWPDWASWLAMNEELADGILNLPYEHIICLAHDKVVRDELLGKVEYRLMVDGQFSDKGGSYFSETYYLNTRKKGDDVEYISQTKPDERHMARSSFDLPMYIPSTLTNILPRKLRTTDQAQQAPTRPGPKPNTQLAGAVNPEKVSELARDISVEQKRVQL